MSSALIARSPDLQRLRDEGYALEIRAGYLLVHDVPYLDARREPARGTLVSELTLAADRTVRPETHVAFFDGDFPCGIDGRPIEQLRLSMNPLPPATHGIPVKHAFSNKPDGGYPDYHAKIVRYVQVIGAPARALNSASTACTFRVVNSREEAAVFRYVDTATSRAGLGKLVAKLMKPKIAIIGLGGTGSYVLDLLAKVPVFEIHIYDGDFQFQHNAYRSPGAMGLEELELRPNKAEHFRDVYSKMRNGIVAHAVYVTAAKLDELAGSDVVFICIDKGPDKKVIIEGLIAMGIDFIDVGMGLEVVDEDACLVGTVRVTSGTAKKHDHIARRVSFAVAGDDDIYDHNIQIVDLNCLNATLAVIRWKQMRGFYQDIERAHHTTYSPNVNQLDSSEEEDEE